MAERQVALDLLAPLTERKLLCMITTGDTAKLTTVLYLHSSDGQADPTRLELQWDLAKETPTLGGALMLRQEAEMILNQSSRERASVHLKGTKTAYARHVCDVAFGSSAYSFEMATDAPPRDRVYPSLDSQAEPGFSYLSMDRVSEIYRQTGIRPRLSWSEQVASESGGILEQYGGLVIACHLRNMPGEGPNSSTADGTIWARFFGAALEKYPTTVFLILGDDALPPEVQLRSRLIRLKDCGVPLPLQLGLVARCDGFLGMASGICASAQFSDVPHVIIKDPNHHAGEMERELGERACFPFSTPHQKLWRREQSVDLLDEALALVMRGAEA